MKKGYAVLVWRQFRKRPLAVAGLCLIGVLFLVAALAPVIAGNRPILIRTDEGFRTGLFARESEVARRIEGARYVMYPPIPYSPTQHDLGERLEPPSGKHLLGTDDRGRDVASRLVHGARISLSVGFVAVAIFVTIGIVMGSLAGYYGGWVDVLISRIIEVWLCFPTLFLILAALAVLPQSIYTIMVIIGLTGWTGVARLVRGEFLKLKPQDFVTASRAVGARGRRIMFRHMLPNALGPVLISATFGVAAAILVESALSFLGFGVPPPTPSWGDTLSQARNYMDFAWWLALFPGLAIFITITSYNLVGEGLRDSIDPRLTEY